MSDTETDPGYRSRSRSQSRRARRKKQSKPKQNPMPLVPENQASSNASSGGAQAQSQAQAHQKPPTVEETGMQPFDSIGPDETSMNGPITYARAQRGEIPARPGNPQQKLATGKKQESNMMDQDGLKLRLELNLDIEIELKASIKGDLTLALMA